MILFPWRNNMKLTELSLQCHQPIHKKFLKSLRFVKKRNVNPDLTGNLSIGWGRVLINKIRDVQIEDLLGREQIKVNLSEITSYLKDQVVLVTVAEVQLVLNYVVKLLIVLQNN